MDGFAAPFLESLGLSQLRFLFIRTNDAQLTYPPLLSMRPGSWHILGERQARGSGCKKYKWN